jgi:hypothetical protein
MRDWLLVLTPIAVVMYFCVRPEHFADVLYWMTRLAS